MKLLIIFCTAPGAKPLIEILDGLGVGGYTVVPEVFGAGASGRHMGTRAHPGVSAMVLVAVDEKTAETILDALHAHRGQCAPDQGFHALQLPIEKAIAGGASVA